jgi:ketosteroid isomerase-like protein
MSDLNAAIAKRLFDAIESGDLDVVDQCYAPDVIVWHNTDGIEQTRAESVDSIRRLHSRVRELRFENRRLKGFEGGFVQQHDVAGAAGDGLRVTMPAVVVGAIRDGRISRIDEYFDTPRLTAFRKLMA